MLSYPITLAISSAISFKELTSDLHDGISIELLLILKPKLESIS